MLNLIDCSLLDIISYIRDNFIVFFFRNSYTNTYNAKKKKNINLRSFRLLSSVGRSPFLHLIIDFKRTASVSAGIMTKCQEEFLAKNRLQQ